MRYTITKDVKKLLQQAVEKASDDPENRQIEISLKSETMANIYNGNYDDTDGLVIFKFNNASPHVIEGHTFMAWLKGQGKFDDSILLVNSKTKKKCFVITGAKAKEKDTTISIELEVEDI